MDKYIFKTNKMHGTYSMRGIKNKKKFSRSEKYRITRLYNKLYKQTSSELFDDSYHVVDFLPYRMKYKNLTPSELTEYDGIDDLLIMIQNFQISTLRYTSEYYIISVSYYYNSDVNEYIPIPVFYSFNGFINLLNTIKRMTDSSQKMGMSTLLGSCVRLKDRKILNFDNITTEMWGKMI